MDLALILFYYNAMRVRYLLFILLTTGCFLIQSCNNQSSDEGNGKEAVQETNHSVLDAIDAVNKKILEDSLNPDLYEERAKIYLEHEAYNEAFKDVTVVLELDSNYAPYYVTQADIYLGMGKLQKTVESLEKAISLDKSNTDAYLRLAEMSIVIRDYKAAIGYIDQALQVDELLDKAYMLRGVILMENNDTTRGIRNFQKAIDVNQNNLEANIQLGTIFAMKKNDLAIDYFNNALNLDPENMDVRYYLGMYYQETQRYDLAIQSYNLILEKNPDFYIALFNIGYIQLVYLQEFETAIDYFTRVIEINPEYTEAYFNRGFAYELMQDTEKSIADYRKTLELHPNYEKAIDGLNRIDDYLMNQ